MFTNCIKYPAQINQFRTIQLQSFDGRPVSARLTTNARKVVTPGEMPGPLLSAGMEQMYASTRIPSYLASWPAGPAPRLE